MMIKGIIFDFDGTLTLPGSLDFAAIKKEMGCPAELAILEYIESQPPSQRDALMEILEKREEEAAGASLPNLGAEGCLRRLKEERILLGLLTRNSLRSVQLAFRQFKKVRLEDFATVVTREFSPPKPDPAGVFRAAEEMGLKTRDLLMVGDFRFDVMAGWAAGAKTVLLTNGRASVMAPDDPLPDFTIRILPELLRLPGFKGDR
jgi:hydrogenase expression/formation protein HypE